MMTMLEKAGFFIFFFILQRILYTFSNKYVQTGLECLKMKITILVYTAISYFDRVFKLYKSKKLQHKNILFSFIM